MFMFKSPPRSAQTTIPCEKCGKPLVARRTCHEAYLRCEACGQDFPLAVYVRKMDEALETFLEAINCDRV